MPGSHTAVRGSNEPWEAAAIQHNILSGYIAGVHAAQKYAKDAELAGREYDGHRCLVPDFLAPSFFR
jgi:hypothetical protein